MNTVVGSYELTMIRKRAPGTDTARTFRSSRNQRYACIPYLPLIWRSGVQRLLQHRLDTDITAKLVTEFLVTLLQVGVLLSAIIYGEYSVD